MSTILNIFGLFTIYYLPRINHFLQKFADSWNLHPLSSEKGKSPEQLWFLGKLKTAQTEDEHVDCDYGIQCDPDYIMDDEENGVVIDSTGHSINRDTSEFNLPDPLSDSSVLGVDLYLQVLDSLQSQ